MQKQAQSSSSGHLSDGSGLTTFGIFVLSAMLGGGQRLLARRNSTWDRLIRASHGLVALFRHRWQVAAVALLGGFVILLGTSSSVAQASPLSCPNGTSLNVVAHQDDDLLFMNPDILHDIQSNRCVVTVYVTAGDAGESDPAYWQGREAGSQAAYAEMAGVDNVWTTSDAGIPNHSIPVLTLSGDPKVSLVFMRLPDGNYLWGTGFATHNYESLQKLWQGTIDSIHPVDDESSSYTRQDLIDTLTSLMTEFQPDLIRTQDSTVGFGNGDHSDHYASALFADAAQINYSTSHTTTSYIDYAVSNYPQNVFGTDLTSKQNAFYTYGEYDSHTCDSAETCTTRPEREWLTRSYVVGTPNADAGGDQTVLTPGAIVHLNGSASSDPNGDPITYSWTQTSGSPGVTLSGDTTATPTFPAPASATTLTFALTVSNGTLASTDSVTVTVAPHSTNIASRATVTASSENTVTGQLAIKAVDGSAEGYPGDYTHEWATLNEGAGAWLNLAWASPQLINRIVLYDRPSSTEQITSATLSFSDGSTVDVPALANNGAAVAFDFPAVSTTSVHLAITSVSDSTVDIGLAEIEVWTPDQAPVANAGLNQNNVKTGATVTLDGSLSSDPDIGDTLSYAWTQTGGPSVTLTGATTAKPTFTAPASATSLTFKLTVSDGTLNDSASVTITVPDRPPVANAGPDQNNVKTGATVTLDGNKSSDPDSGDTLSYAWTQT
ncbi:MAG: PIG-L family deacetylase, partial [Gaiellaceae bacterium]